jgi:predicted GNAT superfamily acetyltransferase
VTADISLRAARAADYDRIVTAPVNGVSIAFHAAMGFTVTGPVDDYDGQSSPKVLFERRLD